MSNAGILATTYIFIETSVFEGENIIEVRKTNKLSELARLGDVQVLLSYNLSGSDRQNGRAFNEPK